MTGEEVVWEEKNQNQNRVFEASGTELILPSR